MAAVKADSEADAYTIGQVASGLTNGGVVTGVGYSGVGHLGYAGVGHLGYAGVGHLGYANQVVAAPAAYGYSGVVASPAVRGYSNLGYGYAGHYGKREAEAEADSDADAYTIAQVAAGLPVHNAIATGHAHNVGVVTGTTYAAPAYAGYRSYAAPAYTGYSGVGHVGYAGLGYSGHAGLGYSGLAGLGYGYAGHYGKREAEAEADAYTIGQVRAGLPLHNAYTAGHGYNAGVVSGYRSYAAPAYTGYAGVGHAGYAGHLGYAGLGYSGLGYTGAYYG